MAVGLWLALMFVLAVVFALLLSQPESASGTAMVAISARNLNLIFEASWCFSKVRKTYARIKTCHEHTLAPERVSALFQGGNE